MRDDRESKTAVLVCAGRALAHGRSTVARYDDPTAMPLLPDEERARVERFRSGPPTDRAERNRFYMTRMNELVMVPRTVAIDDAIREAALPQLVNLGAGLDGRAHRMSALSKVTVFEVDHPASQATKRARAATLPVKAKSLTYVAVDFTRDDLDRALEDAGHDRAAPTFWIWEGVVPYLEMRAIDETLSIVSRRSAKGSRIAIAYITPSRLRRLSLWLSRFGRRAGDDPFEHEPQVTFLEASEMRAVLARHELRVVSDEDVTQIAKRVGASLGRLGWMFRAGRIVVGERG